MRRRLPLLIFLAFGIALIAFSVLFFSRRANAQYGEAVALCPGPDLYGYTCDGGAAFAYIDAGNDTFLYEDDGVTNIPLPFPFTFYGTTYDSVAASSNGNLQFGGAATQYANSCLTDSGAAEMGDMIAPFWDDLDLTSYGYLETELVGEAPERIFVIEWDNIPIYGDENDRVTFAVQLFEANNDILFLYSDVTLLEGNNGSSATIGIQSAAQELALQYSCFQPVVADASQIRFTHPARANRAVPGLTTAALPAAAFPAPAVKGTTAELLTALELYGRPALSQLQRRWRQTDPPQTAVWEWMDLGDGSESLLLIRRGPAARPELTSLLLLQETATGGYAVLLDQPLSRRDDPVPQVLLHDRGDLTADGTPELLLHAPETGHLFVVTLQDEAAALHTLPVRCTGSVGIVDGAVSGDGCADERGGEIDGRVTLTWHDAAFTISNP